MILFLFFAVLVQKTSDFVFFSAFPHGFTPMPTNISSLTRLVEARRAEMFVTHDVNRGKGGENVNRKDIFRRI